MKCTGRELDISTSHPKSATSHPKIARTSSRFFCPQGIVGRLNAYYSFNAAIDAAADALEAQEEKEREEAAKATGSDGVAVDHDNSNSDIVLRLPPIGQPNPGSTGDSERPQSSPPRPRSASRPISTGKMSRMDGWHLD